jgi:V/A-type H+/Na+-transporting ATPase subunit G/H
MSEPSPVDVLSPLDQIRLVEAEIARRTATARASADERVAQARNQAELLKKEAGETGENAGLVRYKEIVAEAEAQAVMILAQADHETEDLRRKGRSRMERAFHQAMNIVVGAKGAQDNDES